MPIYEFYCAACHMLFNFMSPRIDTTTRPACPRCGRPELERRPARFAALTRSGSGGGEDAGEDEDNPFPGLDEGRLERAMESMAGELEGMGDEEDPRQMARFFRRFGEAAGMRLGPRMEEMLRRLERGEDPDALEEEMGLGEGREGGEGDEGELEEWFQLKQTAKRLRQRKPRLDETLYFM